jgi:GTP pyrophosphokinase
MLYINLTTCGNEGKSSRGEIMPNKNDNMNITENVKLVIVECLKFIDDNLCDPLDLNYISKRAGYSKYYLARVFKQYIGLSIMEYVKRRKLTFASTDLLNGEKIIEVALKYGYDSPSGFTKAFVKEFGFSPSMLKTMKLHFSVLGGNYHMSHIFMESTDIHASKEKLFATLLKLIGDSSSSYKVATIEKAYAFACQAYKGILRYSGDEYITHPLNVAIILAFLEVKEDLIISGMMCDIFTKTNITADMIEKEFSFEVKNILLKLHKFDKLSLADIEDEDVITIKLAERLHNMRTVEFMDKSIQQRKAKETLEYFVPFAAKLGNAKLTEELNDLALKFA